MEIKTVTLVVGSAEFPLDAEKTPPEIREEIKTFLEKMDPLMDTLPIPGLLKGRDLEIRIKLRLDK